MDAGKPAAGAVAGGRAVAVGEVGLLGDVREVIAQEKRIKEARRLGYRNVVSSKESKYLQQAIKTFIK